MATRQPGFAFMATTTRSRIRFDAASTSSVPKSKVMRDSGPAGAGLASTRAVTLTGAVSGLLLLAGAGFAAAQTAVVIQPEQETVIREYVQKQSLASINLPGVELNIGSTIPDTVELHAIEVPDVSYRYVVVDGRTVLVDPGTREIVHIIN